MKQISCLSSKFFDDHQYQEGLADATDQLTVNTVLYEEEPVSSVYYTCRVLKLHLFVNDL